MDGAETEGREEVSDQPPSVEKSKSLYAWEIDTIIPNLKDGSKKIRCTMTIAARSLEQVLEYLTADRMDEATEIDRIQRFGPIVSVLEEPKS